MCWIEETKTGIGWHIDDVSTEQREKLSKIMFIHGIINMNAVTFVKISVALNLRRFMQTKKQRIFLAGLISTFSLDPRSPSSIDTYSLSHCIYHHV